MAKICSAAALAASAVVLAIVLLICTAAPGSSAAHLLAHVIPVPDVPAHDYGVEMARAARVTPSLRGPLYVAAEADAVREVRTAPMKPDAWLRLAYVRALASGRVSKGAAFALERSYAIAPIDPALAPWRIHFALEGWAVLSPSLKARAQAELGAIWAANPKQRVILAQAVQSVPAPDGRAAGEAVMTNHGWRMDQSSLTGSVFKSPASLGRRDIDATPCTIELL